MVAAIMFGFFQVRLPDVAAVSLIRFSNNGPRSLIKHIQERILLSGDFLVLSSYIWLH